MEPETPEAAVGAGDNSVLRPLPGDDREQPVIEVNRIAAPLGARESRGGVDDPGVEHEWLRRTNPEIADGAEHATDGDVARR